MFDEEDRNICHALFLAFGVAILVSIFTIGMAGGSAIGQFGSKPRARGTATATLPVAHEAAAAGRATAAPAPAVKIYFELGKSDLPTDVQVQVAPLLATVREQRRNWVISAYYDASGDAAANAELGKQRAFAVRDLIVAAGAPVATIELAKPAVALGSADPRETRRIEDSLR